MAPPAPRRGRTAPGAAHRQSGRVPVAAPIKRTVHAANVRHWTPTTPVQRTALTRPHLSKSDWNPMDLQAAKRTAHAGHRPALDANPARTAPAPAYRTNTTTYARDPNRNNSTPNRDADLHRVTSRSPAPARSNPMRNSTLRAASSTGPSPSAGSGPVIAQSCSRTIQPR